jgi:hypothetical protein
MKIGILIGLAVGLLLYAIIGTEDDVQWIKERAPSAMDERNWKILRYEGYQRGSFANHGGKVWYHVRNVDDPDIQYRVYITKWGGELHFYYNGPEDLSRINIKR